MRQAVIAGSGFVGRRLARRLGERGQPVLGIVRSPASAEELGAAGAEALIADLGAFSEAGRVAGALLYYLAPPPPAGDRDTTLEAFLGALDRPPARLVYMSTTGVYGDCGGERVDEQREPAPATDRARRRLAAEQFLRRWCAGRGVPWIVLRVPGIYGPGRLMLERLEQGEPLLREADAGPGNRIHVDDLVSVCIAAGDSTQGGRVYNVGDGDHRSSTAFQRAVAAAAGLPEPPTISREEAARRFSARRLSFLGESRRIDNGLMLRDLGVRLAYADPLEGIRASLA